MSDVVAEVSALLTGELSELERTRALRDLARVRDRLRRRDYAISAFGTNTFDIPDRADELLTEISFHASIGRAWAAIIRACNLASAEAVIDLCPGYTPKVELGLVYAGFGGTLYALDKEPEAIAALQRFLALFAPRFAVQPVIGDLFTATLAPQPLVLGHHLIDDLVLDDYCRHSGVALADIYRDETVFKHAWSSILKDTRPRDLAPRFADAIAARVAPKGTLILAQYPSYTERLLGLREASAFSVTLLEHICEYLSGRDFTRRDVTAIAEGVSEFAPGSAFRALVRH